MSRQVLEVFEGDLIRPLGLMVLYAAYAEGELDDLLESLSVQEPYDNMKRQWTTGRKLKHGISLAKKFKANNLSELVLVLKDGAILFEKRNSLVHGKLFGGGRLVSNRLDCPEQQVSPKQITDLAESLFSWKEQIWVHRCKHVLPYISSRLGE